MSAAAQTLERLGEQIEAEVRAFSCSGVVAGLALRTALAAVLAVLAAQALELENPVWAGITAFSVLQQGVSATLTRAVDRVLGTIVGAFLGYLAAASVGDHLVFSILCVLIVTFTLYAQARVRRSYAMVLLGVTALLVMFGSLSTPDAALDLAVYRALEITVGVVIASLVDVLLAPRQSKPAAAAPAPGIFTRPVDAEQLSAALSGGLAIACVPIVWTALVLPGLGQTPITAFVIMNAFRRDPQWTSVTRAVGCVLGGAYGLLCLAVVGDSFIFLLGLLFIGLYLSAHVLHRKADASYVGHQAGIAALIAMVAGLAPSLDILPAIDRLVGIFGGIIAVAIFQILFAPLIRWFVLALLDRTEEQS